MEDGEVSRSGASSPSPAASSEYASFPPSPQTSGSSQPPDAPDTALTLDQAMDALDPTSRLNLRSLLERVREKRVVPWIGAGVSCSIFPSWIGLLRILFDQHYSTPCVSTSSTHASAAAANPSPDPNPSPGAAAQAGSPSSPTVTFDEMFYTNLDKSAPIMTDILASRAHIPSAIREVFEEKAMSVLPPVASDKDKRAAFEAFVLGETNRDYFMRGSKQVRDAIKERLSTHSSIVTGPWPLIITTNWDTCLEAAWDLHTSKSSTGEVLRAKAVERGVGLPVRYRKDVSQCFAEMKSGLLPPRLLKLHGDFSPNGESELITGHAEYRKLMVREPSFLKLLQVACSTYSILFVGCSLSDQDLLTTLDDLMESLGSEIGPHFWLTADKVSPQRQEFLLRHYSIRIIKTAEYDYDAIAQIMELISSDGWIPPFIQDLKFTLPNSCSVSIESTKSPHDSDLPSERIVPRPLEPHVHAVLPTNCKTNGSFFTYSFLMRALHSMALKYDPTWRFPVNSNGEASRVFRVPGSNAWIVNAQARATFENPSTTFSTLKEVLSAIIASIPQDEKEKIYEIHLPSIYSPNGDHLDTLRTSLSAVGHFLSSCDRRLSIVFKVPENSSLWSEIHAGKIVPMTILRRGYDGFMSFTCTVPSSENTWTVRRIETAISTNPGQGNEGTFEDLREKLQLKRLPPGYRPSCTLLTYIADGASFSLQPVLLFADINVTARGDLTGRLVDFSEDVRRLVGPSVRIIHVHDNPQVHQWLQLMPVSCIITSARQIGRHCHGLELLQDLQNYGEEYFSGKVVVWSRSMLRREHLKDSFRKLGGYVDHDGDWSKVLHFIRKAVHG